MESDAGLEDMLLDWHDNDTRTLAPKANTYGRNDMTTSAVWKIVYVTGIKDILANRSFSPDSASTLQTQLTVADLDALNGSRDALADSLAETMADMLKR